MYRFATDRELKRSLLMQGLSPQRVRRMLLEWDDHLAELVDLNVERGLSSLSAERVARREIGEPSALVASVGERPELRSVAWRWPVLAFVFAPLAVLVGVIALLILAIFGAADSLQAAQRPAPLWFHDVLALSFFTVSRVVPLLLAAAIAWSAAARFARPLWPVLGIIVVVVLGAAVQLQAQVDAVTVNGSVSVGLALLPPFPDVIGFLSRAALGLGLVLVPYVVWAKTTARTASSQLTSDR